MAITVDFLEKYKHLICEDIPKLQLQSYPHNSVVPEQYRKKFIHSEDSFVKKFCEEYDGREEKQW